MINRFSQKVVDNSSEIVLFPSIPEKRGKLSVEIRRIYGGDQPFMRGERRELEPTIGLEPMTC
jgi:hypothetical protein